jgi:hypothetical protein
MSKHRKAQAVLELAILGSLLIIAFSIAIRYGEQYNRQQSYMQQTFRKALYAAREVGKYHTSFGAADFRRSSNVVDPMELGELQTFSSGNSILWSPMKKDPVTYELLYPDPKAYYRWDRGGLQEVSIANLYNVCVTLSSSVASSPENTTRYNKNGLSSQKTMHATDTISASMPFAGTTVSAGGEELGQGGFYGAAGGGGGIDRSRGLE